MSGRMISRRSVLTLAACTALGAVGCSKTEELFNLSVMGPQIFTFVFQMTFSKVHIENPPYVMFLQN